MAIFIGLMVGAGAWSALSRLECPQPFALAAGIVAGILIYLFLTANPAVGL